MRRSSLHDDEMMIPLHASLLSNILVPEVAVD